MSREPNQRLAALMAEAGASNKGLAKRVRETGLRHGRRVGTTHVTVQRWLNGGGIQPETASLVAEALSSKLQRRITPTDLGFPTAASSPVAVAPSYATSLPDTLDVLDRLAQQSLDDEQSSGVLLPESEVNSAVLSWLISHPDTLRVDVPAQRRVGMRDVAAIRTAGQMFMRLDFLYGGGHGHKALRHYFRQEVLPLLSASYSAKVGNALFGAATEISQLLGWTAYDTGNHALANRYLLSTLRLTKAIDDRMMGARILSNMSHQANYLGQISRATQLARAATEGGKGRATPRAMAMYAAHEARALSSAQDHTSAARAMNEAEKHLERADSAEDPDWLSYVDEAELVGEFCHCFRDLGRGPESLRYAERAVALTDPQYARTLGFCRMVLAQSQLLNGELEAAVTTAGLAVEGGDALQSARFQRYVSDFQRDVSSHAGVPAVQAFNTKVRDALADLDDE
ncbi:sporulation protein [Streptomyces sp. NPDC047108]|uniref:sporulation protein n=1 Tax=Streptomyces sp. NPDC047108 TaxID=3155025 RepID=UPI0033EF3C3A